MVTLQASCVLHPSAQLSQHHDGRKEVIEPRMPGRTELL